MQVKDTMTRKVVTCQEDELLSQVLSKMRKNNFHQLVVVDGSKIKGVVTLNDIVKKNFNPITTKASNILKSAPSIDKNASIEDAAEIIINSDLRAVPVVNEGKELVGIISEEEIIKNIKVDFDVLEASSVCSYVNQSDNIGTVKNIISQKNISRVPILNNGKLVGVIGTMELANIFEHSGTLRDTGGWGKKEGGNKEKINVESTPVTSLMKDPVYVRQPVTSKKVLDMLKKTEQVFIINGDIRIVTPKDVLRLIKKPKETAYFQISGLEEEDSMTVAKMHNTIEKSLKQIAKVTEIQPLRLHVEHHTKGGKTKYSVKAQLPTQLGMFIVSKVWGYNLITTMQDAMSTLEREFWSKHERLRNKEQAAKRRARGK